LVYLSLLYVLTQSLKGSPEVLSCEKVFSSTEKLKNSSKFSFHFVFNAKPCHNSYHLLDSKSSVLSEKSGANLFEFCLIEMESLKRKIV
jgi:hypothetical protein